MATMKKIAQGLDTYSNALVGLNFPAWIDNLILTANTAKTYNIPTGAKFLLFSCTTNFYVAYGGTAVIPSVDVTDGTGVELNPVLRSIDFNMTTISIISPINCIVTISAYK